MTNPNTGSLPTGVVTAPEVTDEALRMNEHYDHINSMSREELVQHTFNMETRLAALEAQASAPEVKLTEAPKGESKIRSRVRATAVAGVLAVGVFFGVSSMDNKGTERAVAQTAPAGTTTAGSTTATPKPAFDSKDTIARTVEALDVDSAKEAKSILVKRMGTSFKLELNNTSNKMNAMPKNSNKHELVAAAGLAMASDSKEGNQYGKAAVNFNSKNDRNINADTGMTAAQQETFNEKVMTGEGKTYIDQDVDGNYENSYMVDGGKMSAKTERFVNQDLLVRETKANGKLMFKITHDKDGKVCLNLVREVEAPAAPKVETKAPSTPETTLKTPHEDRLIPEDKKPSDKPEDKPKDKPNDKPQDKPSEKPKDKPEDKPKDKPNDKEPKPTINQSVPGAPGSGGSPEQGDDPQNDSDVDGYGPGDTVATPTTPTPPATVPNQGNGTPEAPIVNTNPTPVEVVPVTPTPPAVPPTTTPGTPTAPTGPSAPAN